jgi:hypothetical protein
MRSCLIFCTLSLASVTVVSPAQTTVTTPPPISTFKLESGISYSRGDYGLASDTTVWVVPVSAVYDFDRWSFRTTVPWVHIEGPATVFGDVGTGGTGGPLRPTSGAESGIGDSVLSLTYKANPGAQNLNVDLTGRIKLPTGDDAKGLGTGKTDYYAQVDLYRTFGTITPFGTIGYRWLGSGRYHLQDGAYVSGGLLYTLMPGTSVGAAVEWRDKLVAGADSATEASLLLFRRIDEHWNVSFSVMKGFTDASANYGASGQFSFAF